MVARRLARRLGAAEGDAPVGTVVGSVLGLLAFILAFTFGLTASRYDGRKTSLLDEVNAIETAYRRAELIPEPSRSDVRRLMREYVDLRVGLIEHPERAHASIARAEAIQDEIWAHATALGHAQLQNPPIVALFVNTLNTMFDLQTKRVTLTLHHRIPMPIWWALMGITAFAMLLVGYLFGLAKRVPWLPLLVFSSAFSIVLVLIADLDGSGGQKVGMVRLNQRPMLDLQQRMRGD
jgi:hypothetical protein